MMIMMMDVQEKIINKEKKVKGVKNKMERKKKKKKKEKKRKETTRLLLFKLKKNKVIYFLL